MHIHIQPISVCFHKNYFLPFSSSLVLFCLIEALFFRRKSTMEKMSILTQKLYTYSGTFKCHGINIIVGGSFSSSLFHSFVPFNFKVDARCIAFFVFVFIELSISIVRVLCDFFCLCLFSCWIGTFCVCATPFS